MQIVSQFTITKTSLAFGVVDKAYQDTLEAAGGEPPFTWSALPATFSNEMLPPGLSLDPNGQVIGVPTATGSFNPRIEVRDSANPQRVATANAFLHIGPRVSFQTTTLPHAVEQVFYGRRVFFSGGMTPYTVRLSSGALPPGLSLSASVLITSNSLDIVGTPTEIGQFPFTLEVTDSTTPPDTISQPFSIQVNSKMVFDLPPSLPDALEGLPYSFSLSASGGLLPYVWTLPGAPAGLAIDRSSGVISGTPTQAFTGSLDILLFDSGTPPQIINRFPAFRVLGILKVATTSLPQVRAGESVSIQPFAVGGELPYSWSVVSGMLPAGISLNPTTGGLSGRPTAVESQTFVLEVRDSSTSFPQTAQRTLTLNVAVAPGRNDSIPTATPLSNGRYAASLSPADASGMFAPDADYYEITANAGAIVSVETFAERLSSPSSADTVIEIVDSSGTRLTTCSASQSGGFFQSCMNDDRPSGSTDSEIFLQVPGSPGTPVTFHVRVLDWTGGARPDFGYEISISGAN